MESIVFLDRETLPPQVHLRRPSFEHRWVDYARTADNEVAGRLRDATIAITNKVPIRRDALRELPQLRLIAVAATGMDIVDQVAAAEHRVAVVNVSGYAVNSVAEHVFALLLNLRRRVCDYREAVRTGRWQSAEQFCFFDYPIGDLAGGVLGILGGGTIGRRVGGLGEAFGMRVCYAARPGAAAQPGRASLSDLLSKADVISLHCPLTPETKGIINSETLALMKPTALLINTARGGLVDDAALLSALEHEKLGGAALDVATAEPPLTNSAMMQLAARENVIVTPHVAWASEGATRALGEILIDNIEQHIATSNAGPR